MKPHNVGLMSPGHMGQAVAEQLKNNGFAVYTALEKRSARTRALAAEAGITDVGSIARLTQRCDVILSIVPSDQALPLASEVAQALQAHRRQMLFADCNAIAPGTMREIAEKITRAGGRCIDACILEPPPRGDAEIQVYLAGEHAHELEQLATPQIRMRVVSARIGDASAIKMCLCAANKGRTTLMLSLLIAARRLGVSAEAEAKIRERHGAFHDEIIAALPKMPPKAQRLVAEMQEVARTFEEVGITPHMFEGAADIYEFVASTALGRETPENRDRSRSGQEIVEELAKGRR